VKGIDKPPKIHGIGCHTSQQCMGQGVNHRLPLCKNAPQLIRCRWPEPPMVS